ncbi:hypothetical protein HZ326_28670 [Fusarium oxysporum f. sp. albedinis]|nr:hypothetical protein HZ326_28670 [Fusarium oxysporum f. sp. albedinis]
MVRFLGRDLETTVVPNKPIPRGFKAWAVAQEGYFLRWLRHRPHRKYGPVGVRPAYRRKSPQNCGFHEPLVKLKKVGNTAAADLEFNYLTAVPTKGNLVNQIIWKDNALVLFLSTVFTGVERVDRKRKRPTTDQPSARPIKRFFGAEPVKVISISSIAAIDNEQMNAVDQGDQRRAYWSPDRRVRRGIWKALAWDFLLEIALINSFILQLKGQPQ